MADLRGALPAQNFLNFMQFFGKFDKIICWRPLLEGWRPLLRRILDPPLPTLHVPLFLFQSVSIIGTNVFRAVYLDQMG